MFSIDKNTGAVTLNAGDTGAYKITATRETEEQWTENDRMMYTVVNNSGVVVLQRYYRLDTELGNGVVLIQFHNDDTDTWSPGTYQTECQYWVNPSWNGTVPTGDVTNALEAGVARMIEGDVRRIPEERVNDQGVVTSVRGQSTLTILRTYGGE